MFKLAAVIPELMSPITEQYATTIHYKASMHGARLQCEKMWTVLAVDCFAKLNNFFRPLGEYYAALQHLRLHALELSYNSTLTGAFGIGGPDTLQGAKSCSPFVSYTDDWWGKIKYSVVLYIERYCNENIPLQLTVALKLREVIINKFLLVPVAESYYTYQVQRIRTNEGFMRTFGYVTNKILRVKDMDVDCINKFRRQGDEKYLDFITSLPNIFTSFMAFSDTLESGYANLVCARTTHVNHIYAGSLKQYVFASQACASTFKSKMSDKEFFVGEIPTCAYRDDNKTKQDIMCQHLVAFADYNSIPLCNAGDALIEQMKTTRYAQKIMSKYSLGLMVAVWNCLNSIAGKGGLAECASSISEEAIPPDIMYDTAECQGAENNVRIMNFVISLLTPIFDMIYKETGYPMNGYYTYYRVDNMNTYHTIGNDMIENKGEQLEHVQARPIEAALVTLGTAALTGQWAVHTSVAISKVIIELMRQFQGSSGEPGSKPSGIALDTILDQILDVRRQVMKILMRNSVFMARDLLFGVLEMARAFATVVNFADQNKYYTEMGGATSNPPQDTPDPRVPTESFVKVQKAITDLANLAQSFIDLIQDALLDLMDAYTQCVFLLVKGIVGGDGAAIGEFFVKFFEMMGGILTKFIKEAAMMLLRKGSPLHFICKIVDFLVGAICDILTNPWIPTGMDIHCGGKKNGCSWWPFNGDIEEGEDGQEFDGKEDGKYEGERGPESEFGRINTQTGREYALISTTRTHEEYVGYINATGFVLDAIQRTEIQTAEVSHLGSKGYVQMHDKDPVLVQQKREYIASLAPEPRAMPFHLERQGRRWCTYGKPATIDQCKHACHDFSALSGYYEGWNDNRLVHTQSTGGCHGGPPGCSCITIDRILKGPWFKNPKQKDERYRPWYRDIPANGMDGNCRRKAWANWAPDHLPSENWHELKLPWDPDSDVPQQWDYFLGMQNGPGSRSAAGHVPDNEFYHGQYEQWYSHQHQMVCTGNWQVPKKWHLERDHKGECPWGMKTPTIEECQDAVDYIMVTQFPGKSPGKSMMRGHNHRCDDNQNQEGWAHIAMGCNIQTGGDFTTHYTYLGPRTYDENSGVPGGCDVREDGMQLVCSGEAILDDVTVKNFREDSDQYKRYCDGTVATVTTDGTVKNYCTHEPIRLRDLETDETRKVFVMQSACLRYRKCIAGVGDKWFDNRAEDSTDTVAPCFWDDLSKQCFDGISFAERSTYERDAEPVVYYWNYETWYDQYQADLRMERRPDYQGDPIRKYNNHQLQDKKRSGDGRSGAWTTNGIKRTWLRQFGHCADQLKEEAEDEAEDEAARRRRKLLAFKDVLEEYDPEERRSRELLWGKVGSGVSDLVDNAIAVATKPIDVMVDLANDVAAVATDIANEATAIAGKALNAIKSVKDMAVDLANKVAELPDMIWGAIYGVIPTSFKLNVSSLSEIKSLGLTGVVTSLHCNDNDFEFCSWPPENNTDSFEATVCNSEHDCDQEAWCVTADQDLCPALTDTTNVNGSGDAAWAKPCLCDTLRKISKEDGTVEKHPYHCNYASGMCNAGYTPFRPPIDVCADEGGLIYGSSGYNSLCFISPIWKCAGKPTLAAKNTCRGGLGWRLQGPSLCRAFCAPTWENRNNRLAQYRFNEADNTYSYTCVCEVGVDRTYPDAENRQSSIMEVSMNETSLDGSIDAPNPSYPSGKGKGRRLQAAERAPDKAIVATRCTTTRQCEGSFEQPTICTSLWDTAVTCYSCSERVHGSTTKAADAGYACNADTKTCECKAPKQLDPLDERSRPDDAQWRGNSWCDEIMRA